jgi:hypothetical protein
MATLYYNAAVDTAWDTLGNWWNDIGFSDPALALPATGDNVKIYAQMDSGPSTSVTLNSIYVNAGSNNIVFTGAIGNATFDGSYNSGYVNGNAIFNNGGQASGASTSGNCTFNGSCINYGGIGGDATFNDYSYNTNVGTDGSIGGNATFNNHSYNYGGTIYYNATFNDNSYNAGITNYNAGISTFNAPYTYNNGEVTGVAYFHGNYGNSGTCDSDAYFYDDTYNIGTIVGNAYFYDRTYNDGGTLNGYTQWGGIASSARFNQAFAGSVGPQGIYFDMTFLSSNKAFPLWRLLKLPFPLNP